MKTVLATILLAAFALNASAHEYWLEPDSFFPIPNQMTGVHLFVGEALKREEERVYQGAKTTSFQLFGPTGIFDLRPLADEDKSPILKFSSDKPGTFLFSMERDAAYITLDPAKFEDYLRDEGMSYIVAERNRLGESTKDGRERYSRYIKMLLQVGDGQSGIVKNRVNSRLEIVPLDNPYSKKPGQTMELQVWFDKRPLAKYTIFADSREGDKIVTQKLTTDEDGKADLKLTSKGSWLVRLVVMKRCEKRCENADWESFWGALSFGVR